MKLFPLLATSVLLLAATGPAQPAAASAIPSRPNLVVILADDLGYGDVQCYNPDRGKIRTPNIDRLAAQGLRFTDGHSSSGVCSPSRYSLLTGRYHWRTRLQSGIVNLWGPPLIAPDRLTIAGLARQHGYRTACIGKWHLGWEWPIPADQSATFKAQPKGAATANAEHRVAWREVFSQTIPGGPATRGFDSYFGTDVPNWPPFCFIENDRTLGIPTEFLPPDLLINHLGSLQGPALPDWSFEPILPALAARAVQFVNRAAGSTQPFLLYLPLTSPHTPLAPNPNWKGQSGLGVYADLVMETDAAVGQVLAALESARLATNTLVVFTSDNGCAHYIGVPKMEAAGHFPSGPLRGYKSDAWEGGHRVPFIVRWPGVVKPGTTSGQLVHQADLMATFAAIFGATLPPNAGEDSFSFLPLLQGEDRPIRENAVNCSSRGTPALRLGSWKIIAGNAAGGLAKTDDDATIKLFNLASDLAETTNLATSEPGRVKKMQALLEQLIVEGRSTPGPSQTNDVQVQRYPRETPAGKAAKKTKKQ